MWSQTEDPDKWTFAQPTRHISKNNRKTYRSTRTSNMVVKCKHLLSTLAIVVMRSTKQGQKCMLAPSNSTCTALTGGA